MPDELTRIEPKDLDTINVVDNMVLVGQRTDTDAIGKFTNQAYKNHLGIPTINSSLSTLSNNIDSIEESIVALETVTSSIVNVKQYGAVGDGVTDDTEAIQDALDANAGRVILFPVGTYLITDTIYVPPATIIRGEGPGDPFNIGGTYPKTTIQLSVTSEGIKRIWTDVGLPNTPAGTLVDDPISVGVVLTGGGIGVEDIRFRSNTDVTDSVNTWDVILMAAGAFRLHMKNVETQGSARYCGFLLDATWSNANTALQNLHTSTYGRTVPSSGSSNEIHFQDCYFFGGEWGFICQGTKRTDTSANIWSTGGVSDLTAIGCRVGNQPIRLGTQGNGQPIYSLNSGGYKRDLHNSFQNRYWFGCSFRATSGCSVYLDRGRFEQFIGVYGEQRGDRVPSTLVTKTIDDLGLVNEAYTGNWVGTPALVPREVKIYLTDTSRIDPITNGIKPRTLWTTATGSFILQAVGYDDSVGRVFVTVNESDVTGTITAGQTVTQAAGQTIGTYGFYCTDRAETTYTQGQSAFRGPERNRISFIGANGALIGGNFRTVGLVSTKANLGLGANDSVSINCESGSQINFRINQFGTSSLPQSRLRYLGTSLESYDLADLGSTTRRWGTFFGTNLDLTSPLPITQGGTSSTTPAAARASLGVRFDSTREIIRHATLDIDPNGAGYIKRNNQAQIREKGITDSGFASLTRATSVMATNASGVLYTASSGQPTLNYPRTTLPGGLGIWRQASNLVLWSQDTSNAWWIKTGLGTPTVNLSNAPDTTSTGNRLTCDTSTGLHALASSSMTSLTTTDHYSLGFYIRRNNHNRFRCNIKNSATTVIATFDINLSTGIPVISGTNASSVLVTNANASHGYHNIQVYTPVTIAATGATIELLMLDSNGNESWTSVGTEAVDVWGFQFERWRPTPYVGATTGSAVTRNADIYTIPLSEQWYSSPASISWYIETVIDFTEGSTAAEYRRYLPGFRLSTTDYIIPYISGTGLWLEARNASDTATATQFSGLTIPSGALLKIALSYTNGVTTCALNGSTATISRTVTPSSFTTLTFGQNTGDGRNLNSRLGRLLFFPLSLTATQLQDMTR